MELDQHITIAEPERRAAFTARHQAYLADPSLATLDEAVGEFEDFLARQISGTLRTDREGMYMALLLTPLSSA